MSKHLLKHSWRYTTPVTTIVIPTRNEADNVLLLVGKIRLALSGRPVEVLFIDDSTDLRTAKVITAARLLYRTPSFHVRMYHRSGQNRWGGLSGAVTDGLNRARANQVIVMDGDLQHPPETLPELIRTAERQSADVVVASRYTDGGKADGLDGGIRHMVSRGSTNLAKLFFPHRLRNVTDPMTGFFLVNKASLDVTLLRPKGFKILLEILARHPRLHVAEVPFSFAERHAGASKGTMKQGMEFFGQLFSLKQANNIDAFLRLPKFASFGIVGGGVFALGMVLLYALVEIAGVSPLIAGAIQLVVTFLLNFALNKSLTWRERQVTHTAATKFFISRVATTLLNFQLFAFLIQWQPTLSVYGQSITFSIHYLLANVICLVAMMLLNFVISDRWAFAEKRLRRHRPSRIPYTAAFASIAVISLVYFGLQNAGMTLAVALAIVGLATFTQACIEVWRMLYTYREPEAVSKISFPKPLAPKEKFLIIVPARHESEVLASTLTQLARQTHPNVTVVSVMCDDDLDTLAVAYGVASNEPRVHVLEYPLEEGKKPSKPLQLNFVLDWAKDKRFTTVGIIDAEDTVHPELLEHVDTAFRDRKVGIVQGGVQLMNHDTSWYSLHNVLEYWRWFNSTMAFQADSKFMPLGGNTIFLRHKLLQKVGGWPLTLTEDCSLGVLLSTRFHVKTAVYYDPKLATQEEAPDTLKGLFLQRVRWNQGFFHEWRKGLWKELPRFKQRMLAGYVLAGPLQLAFSGVMLVITLLAMTTLKAPVALVMLMYLPLLPMLLMIILSAMQLHDFGQAFKRKVTARQYATLLITFGLYQVVLNTAALWSLIRELRGDQSWHKTAHTGKHRGEAAPQLPAALPSEA